MVMPGTSIKNQHKLKDINHLLELEGVNLGKTKPRAQYLGNKTYRVTNETLCVLVSDDNILIIHDGFVERVNELSPEEIVQKLKKYVNEKKEKKAKKAK